MKGERGCGEVKWAVHCPGREWGDCGKQKLK